MIKEFSKKKTVTLFKKSKEIDSSYTNLNPLGHSDFFNGRNILFPAIPTMTFPPNTVRTSKYSILTWAPKSLLWQFRRISNIYFLLMSILSALPFSPKNPFSMGGTFAVVLFFTMIKEAYEDYYRHKQDHKVNSVICRRINLESKTVNELKAKDLKVGDMIIVNENEYFPADLIMISSSDHKGIAYVDTANLDGESNLKEKVCVEATKGCNNISGVSDLRISVECDQPNPLFEWNCNIQLWDKEKTHIGLKQLLLKGCTLKNTKYIYGLVVYTGHDTKIMQNSKSAPSKQSNVLKKMNKILYTVFAFQISICLIFAALSTAKSSSLSSHTYLSLTTSNPTSGYFLQVLTFWVAYSHLIPISLYVALEVLKLILAHWINVDVEMTHNESSARCKASDLIEELGQVEFIFSDKTGTLTCNEMVFRRCMVNGIIYGKTALDFGRTDSPEYVVMNDNRNVEHVNLKQFCTVMAVCSSVFPSYDSDNKVKYQASSPDELALVSASAKLGITLAEKIDSNLYIEFNDRTEIWEILAEIPFTSDRKRMSVVTRHPRNKKIMIMTKGADSVIIPRLAAGRLDSLNSTLTLFANEGLRCLVLAQRYLTGAEYHDWHDKWKKVMLGNDPHKDDLLNEIAEKIEVGLEFIGCTGIEDKLQQGVPECIESLIDAKIRLWVLTGDKEETAIEIGKSCNLIKPEMEVINLSSSSPQQLIQILSIYNERYQLQPSSFDALETEKSLLLTNLCIIINGSTLTWVLSSDELKEIFFKLGFLASSCICCRVSPAQKMQIVQLAKRFGHWISLAIGDGANDVSMIQEAHIGFGISGKEGTQASQSADFVINQFRFLQKFLLVHGRWGYKRVSWFICYYFYKNIAIVFTELWFALFNGYSGQIFFLDWLPLLYNSLWTSWPCLITFSLEQDVDMIHSIQFPQLYRVGQEGRYFTMKQFWKWVGLAAWHGSFTFWICENYCAGSVDQDGAVKDLWWVSTLCFSVIMNIVTAKLYIESQHWNALSIIAGIASLLAYYFSIIGLSYDSIAIVLQNEARGMANDLLGIKVTWVILAFIPVLALLPDFILITVGNVFFPGISQKVRMIEYGQPKSQE